ncbi:hypothetical protein B0H15DRAFT_188849 [Mycena belliarum]|uniref:Uncharacterized protein n=1 Tax=Mycena belliarum TaxID=1033014 RepID=A0AAD6UGR7_9AGAR|nr:hypothetical protein B0H15DRAFT_188849 [Mycena belliae]
MPHAHLRSRIRELSSACGSLRGAEEHTASGWCRSATASYASCALPPQDRLRALNKPPASASRPLPRPSPRARAQRPPRLSSLTPRCAASARTRRNRLAPQSTYTKYKPARSMRRTVPPRAQSCGPPLPSDLVVSRSAPPLAAHEPRAVPFPSPRHVSASRPHSRGGTQRSSLPCLCPCLRRPVQPRPRQLHARRPPRRTTKSRRANPPPGLSGLPATLRARRLAQAARTRSGVGIPLRANPAPPFVQAAGACRSAPDAVPRGLEPKSPDACS